MVAGEEGMAEAGEEDKIGAEAGEEDKVGAEAGAAVGNISLGDRLVNCS